MVVGVVALLLLGQETGDVFIFDKFYQVTGIFLITEDPLFEQSLESKGLNSSKQLLQQQREQHHQVLSSAGMEGETKITAYRPVKPKKFPESRIPHSAESKYWKSFSSKNIERQIASVSCIHFCPEPPHHFAVTSSTRV